MLNRTRKSALRFSLLFGGVIVLCLGIHSNVYAQKTAKPLKIFILAGQSNMDGHAKTSSFEHLAMDPDSKSLLTVMQDKNGKPTVCDHVWISYAGGKNDGQAHGKLTTGWGARLDATKDGGKIGPEFTFGITMEQTLNEPILIIKTAWGGKSLHTDFRPPSAGAYEFNEQELKKMAQKGKVVNQAKLDREKATGRYYKKMIKHVKEVLADVGRVCPDYDPKAGYELAGFVWFQGWNDLVATDVYPNRGKPGGYDLYSELMADFIIDVRTDLNAPKLPFVIGVLGVNGPVDQFSDRQKRLKATYSNFRKAMAAPADLPEFRGNVTAVLTEDCWDQELGAVALKKGEVSREAQKLRKANKGYPESSRDHQPCGSEKTSRGVPKQPIFCQGPRAFNRHHQQGVPLPRIRENHRQNRKGVRRSDDQNAAVTWLGHRHFYAVAMGPADF